MGKQPNLGYIRKLGSKLYVHVPKQKREVKFDPRAKVSVLFGFERGNSYKVFFPGQEIVVISLEVMLDKSNCPTPVPQSLKEGCL